VSWGSWIGVVCFALVLPATSINWTAGASPSPATTLLRVAVPPAAKALTDAPCAPDNDDDSPDLDDSDSDDDDALLAGTVTIAPPVQRGIGYRTLEPSSYESPDSDQLLRPPQRYVD